MLSLPAPERGPGTRGERRTLVTIARGRSSATDHGEAFATIRALANQAFSRAAGASLVEGNSIRLLKDAAENYPAWLEAIGRATRSVHFGSYIIHDDEVGEEFARALIARSRAGLRRVRQIGEVHRLHIGRELPILHDDIELVVAEPARNVQVGRADTGPATVRDRRLRVEHGAVPLEDPHPRMQ